MLLSLGLPLPKAIFVHGFITVDGQKMSKSLGNIIDPFELVKKYGTDAVRYFLLREIPPTEDGDFTYEKFEQRYNADLASGLGNLVARVLTLAEKLAIKLYLPVSGLSRRRWQAGSHKAIEPEVNKTWRNYKKALDEFKFNEALVAIWKLISFCDKYIEREKLWKQTKNQQSKINNLLFALAHTAHLLKPFLPETAEKILKQLGIKPTDRKWTPLEIQQFLTGQEFKIKKGKPLFPRLGS